MKTDQQVEADLQKAEAWEENTKPIMDWVDGMIVLCIAAIV